MSLPCVMHCPGYMCMLNECFREPDCPVLIFFLILAHNYNATLKVSTTVIKETKSTTRNIFRKKIYFLFKSFVKVELSYVFTINLFTIAENCIEKCIIL